MRKIIFKNYFLLLIVPVLMLSSFLLFARSAAADTWTTLDMPGVLRPMSYGISGTNIVGTYDDELANQHGFLYDGTTWTTLDAPGAGAWDTNITDIDDNNIVGYYIDGSTYHGALYSVQSGTWTNIDAPGAISTTPNGISGNKIVGNYYDDFERHGFLYDGISWTNIDMPGAIFTQPLGVDGNNIVGYYVDASSNQHGFLYNGTTWTTFDAPGAISVTPNDIDGNNIVGSVAYASGVELSFIYDGKTWKTFHIPGAASDGAQGAQGIDGNRIIGYYGFDEFGNYHGFLYTIFPTTAATTMGTLGENGWYVSDVQVNFDVTDDLSGVQATYYSLDGAATSSGATINITTEGKHTLTYYSVDKEGNKEPINTIFIKIDKISPEAKISVNPTTKDILVQGVDQIATTSVVEDFSGNYTITNDAGHTTKLFFDKIINRPLGITRARLISVQYDGAPAIKLPSTYFYYAWNLFNGTLLSQTISVDKTFLIEAFYDSILTKQTTVSLKKGSMVIHKKFNGLEIPQLTMEKGVEGYNF